MKIFCIITILGWFIFIQTNMVYHIRTRNFPYYVSGYDWSFFIISNHYTTSPVETFYLWQTAQSSHNSQHKRQLALARIQTPELMLYFWSGGKLGNHCTIRAGSVTVTNSQITWALTCANTGSCMWPWLALVATVAHMVANGHNMWLAR